MKWQKGQKERENSCAYANNSLTQKAQHEAANGISDAVNIGDWSGVNQSILKTTKSNNDNDNKE